MSNKTLTYGSICSGIEAATVAWESLEWNGLWFSEIEKFPCELLSIKYPHIPNYDDMTTFPSRIANGEIQAPDILIGGTPCQAFSMAGKRLSLADDRGNLTLFFTEILDAIDRKRNEQGLSPALCIWENVKGALSTKDNAFGCLLGKLAGENIPLQPPRGKWTNSGIVRGPKRNIAWRVLDSQYFGLAQQRKRVYVIACDRTKCPEEILFEFESMYRNETKNITKQEKITNSTYEYSGRYNNLDNTITAPYKNITGTLCARDFKGVGSQFVDEGKIVCEFMLLDDQGGSVINIKENPKVTGTLRRESHGHEPSIVFLDKIKTIKENSKIRRLTPTEYESLQGFPLNYTRIPWKGKSEEFCPDGLRYKAIGNSMSVPVIKWIGERIVKILN